MPPYYPPHFYYITGLDGNAASYDTVFRRANKKAFPINRGRLSGRTKKAPPFCTKNGGAILTTILYSFYTKSCYIRKN